ncbi:hypothetical protein H8356DRAFT_1321702 [Neocallimastix lanati (nom. inval.)]|nr:hypothetical protein H8356DRAFT_1321702 [Neocallimastix sp. JGI-2020a]
MEQKFYYSNYLDSYSILFYSVTLPINSIYLENENGVLFNSIIHQIFLVELKIQIENYQKKKISEYFKDFSDITQVKATVGSQLNSEVFDVPDSSTDYKDILTPISHYELTISDSKALKELLKYNNIKASCSGAFYDKDGINSMYLFIPFVDSATTYDVVNVYI